jgi:hypothetical protein
MTSPFGLAIELRAALQSLGMWDETALRSLKEAERPSGRLALDY